MAGKVPPEPFRIKMVEPVHVPGTEDREKALKAGHFNMFGLRAADVYIDLLTDSGTGAMSKQQWAAIMMGDEAYAGADSFYALKKSVKDVLGFDYASRPPGRTGGERGLRLLEEGDVIPFNMPFDTTRGHVFNVGASSVDCVIDEAFDRENLHPFKGNVDLKKLEDAIAKYGKDRIPFIMVTITNNSGGGQPVSLQNLRDVSAAAKKHGIPLLLDAARMAENAWFIKHREKEFADLSVAEILKETMNTADAITVSCKKDPLVNIGGLIACRTEEMYYKLTPRVILFEGFATYGGLAGRDLEALAVGLREMVNEEHLTHGCGRWYLGRLLSEGRPLHQRPWRRRRPAPAGPPPHPPGELPRRRPLRGDLPGGGHPGDRPRRPRLRERGRKDGRAHLPEAGALPPRHQPAHLHQQPHGIRGRVHSRRLQAEGVNQLRPQGHLRTPVKEPEAASPTSAK
ncbi:hypothetical protein MASR1M66_20960 [Aminivibrio sp.]